MAPTEGIHQYEVVDPGAWSPRDDPGITACALCQAGVLSIDSQGVSDMRWMSQSTLLTDQSLFWWLCEDYYESVPTPLRFEDQAVFLARPETDTPWSGKRPRHRPIHRRPAQALTEGFFSVSETVPYERLTAKDEFGPVVMAYDATGDHHPHLQIPVHVSCLAILDHFISLNAGTQAYMSPIQSLSEAWDLLRSHHIPHRGELQSHFEKMLENEAEKIGGRGTIWWGYLAVSGGIYGFNADPSVVTEYTQSLVDCAPRLSNAEAGIEAGLFDQKLNALPKELVDRILDYLCPLSGTSAACTRIVAPATWRRWLAGGRIVPFLWDLDVDLLDSTECNAENIDWELLVRMLVQHTVIDINHIFHGLPAELRNRRRIWQFSETMRYDDLLLRLDAEESGEAEDLQLGGEEVQDLDNGEEAAHGQGNHLSDEYTSGTLHWVGLTKEQRKESSRGGAHPEGGHWELRWRREREVDSGETSDTV